MFFLFLIDACVWGTRVGLGRREGGREDGRSGGKCWKCVVERRERNWQISLVSHHKERKPLVVVGLASYRQ